MEERLTVFVNGKPVTVFRGMTVKHALISLDYCPFIGTCRGRKGGR